MSGSEVDLQKLLRFSVQLAREAGAQIKEASEKRWTAGGGLEEKMNSVDLVTETDQAVEKLVIGRISEEYPDHSFIGEESSAGGASQTLTAKPTWIVDPVDGTTNFVHGFPYVCISIGFCLDQEPVVGVIYNPFLDQMFQARKGAGAYLNDRRLPLSHPSPQPLRSWGEALVGAEWGSQRSEPIMDRKCASFKKLVADGQEVPGALMVRSIRSVGSCALSCAHLAAGMLDAWWEIGCYSWDVCAGIVIAREAGCKVWARGGQPLDSPEALSGRHYFMIRAVGEGPEGKSGEAAQDHLQKIFQQTVTDWDV